MNARQNKRANAEDIGIDERFISDMVEQFYASIRADELLGPIFAKRVADWPAHLLRMKQFWRSVLHNSGEFSGNPMAKQGLAGVALSISAWSSFVGALVATVGIVFFAPLLADWALSFGPAEYFALMVFAIACLGGMVGEQPVKTLLATMIGLALATVGVDANSGVYRFTFDDVHLVRRADDLVAERADCDAAREDADRCAGAVTGGERR